MPEKPRSRFTLAGLMAIMAYVCLTSAVVAAESGNLLCVHQCVTIGTLTFAVCGALLATGDRRRFWIGFAVFGLVFLVLGISQLFQRYIPYSPGRIVADAIEGYLNPTQYQGTRNEINYALFNGAMAILAGLVGGTLLRWAFPVEPKRENAN